MAFNAFATRCTPQGNYGILPTLKHVVVVPLIQCPKPNYNRLWALDDWYFRIYHICRAFLSCLWSNRVNDTYSVYAQVSRHDKKSESNSIDSEGRCSRGCCYRQSRTEIGTYYRLSTSVRVTTSSHPTHRYRVSRRRQGP